MDIKKLTKDYMTSIKHMQLATTNNSQPWLCTVYFVNDDNFCLYWASRRSRQHSLEILKSSKAAITIVKDSENKQALQIIGNAYEVEENDLFRVHELYTSKFGPNEYNLDEMKQRIPEGQSYWVFKPTKISLWDEVNFPNSPKQSFNLN